MSIEHLFGNQSFWRDIFLAVSFRKVCLFLWKNSFLPYPFETGSELIFGYFFFFCCFCFRFHYRMFLPFCFYVDFVLIVHSLCWNSVFEQNPCNELSVYEKYDFPCNNASFWVKLVDRNITGENVLCELILFNYSVLTICSLHNEVALFCVCVVCFQLFVNNAKWTFWHPPQEKT